jgi:hypothetical protein
MDVRSQQIVVQQHMNDRLAEARMARLAREAQLATRAFEQKRTPVARQARHAEPQGAGFLANFFDALAVIGKALTPPTPVRVPVRR